MSTLKNSKLLWLDYIAIAIIVIAFFVISYCGFFMGDDIYMNYGVSTLSDVLEHTKMFYHTYGGRLFSVASQYLFSGVLGNSRIWFVVVNTLFFVLFIMTCGRLIGVSKEKYVFSILLFALLFWFLCPEPGQTLFWTAGSTTYLWANTLAFVFLLFFQKYKDDDFRAWGKLGLFMMSFFAATEFITCASICGAFVVYYAFHIKKFKGNVVPFVVGFSLGSMALLFAPGNFGRVGREGTSILGNILSLFHHPLLEIVKYKALWLFLMVLVWGWLKNKEGVKSWVKNNSILLLSLGWSVIAVSLVFGIPGKRVLFFTETLSIVLLLKLLFGYFGVFKIPFIDKFLCRNLSVVKSALVILLFVLFSVDSVSAVVETKRQRENYDEFLSEIVSSGGLVALDRKAPSHRMAYCSGFYEWECETLADKYGLDSVVVYPYYCLDKYYKQVPPMENIYIDEYNYKDDNDIFGKYVRLIVRIASGKIQEQKDHVVFTINYSKSRKWYKTLLDKWNDYQDDRIDVVERDNPEVCYDGYCYYVIWFGRENSKNLKGVKYEVE